MMVIFVPIFPGILETIPKVPVKCLEDLDISEMTKFMQMTTFIKEARIVRGMLKYRKDLLAFDLQ